MMLVSKTVPPIVVLVTDDAKEAADVAQRYADMTGVDVDVHSTTLVATATRQEVVQVEPTPYPLVVHPGTVDGGKADSK